MDSRMEARLVDGLRRMVSQRRLRTRIYTRRCASFGADTFQDAIDGLLQDSYTERQAVAVDVAGASAGLVAAVRNMPCFVSRKGRLFDFEGCPDVEAFNQIERRITVENVLALSDRYAKMRWVAPDWPALVQKLPALFAAYVRCTEGKNGDARLSDFSRFLREKLQFNALDGGKKKLEYIRSNWPEPPSMYRRRIAADRAAELDLLRVLEGMEALGLICALSRTRCEDDYEEYVWRSNLPSIEKLFDVPESGSLQLVCMPDRAVVRQPTTSFAAPAKGHPARPMFDAMLEAGAFENDGGSYRFANLGVREILMNQGSLLETYLYHMVRLSGAYTDVDLSCDFAAPVSEQWDRHELDVVAVAGGRTIFFSCKSGSDFGIKDVYEIAELSRRYGYNRPRAVFVISCSEPVLIDKQMQCGGIMRSLVEAELDVVVLDRTILSDPKALIDKLIDIADD